jgi:hypothetical protein
MTDIREMTDVREKTDIQALDPVEMSSVVGGVGPTPTSFDIYIWTQEQLRLTPVCPGPGGDPTMRPY